MTPQEAAKKIIVALDSTDPAVIASVAHGIGPHVGMVKVGLEAYVALGPPAIESLREAGCRVFLDLKFNDIPNTVSGAVRAATGLGVAMLNVHALSGLEAMRAAVRARDEAWEAAAGRFGNEKPALVAVTVLTSLDYDALASMGLVAGSPMFGDPDDVRAAKQAEVRRRVARLAEAARDCGLDGVVCSPQEITEVRERCGKGFRIVTPGVRPAWAQANDQKRVLTPAQAVSEGADYLVVGRPILDPPKEVGTSEEAVKRIVKEIIGDADGT